MNKTIGILAHVDAGKTTFAEQLLYHTKSIRQRGRVDNQDAFLDSHQIEKERGITVFADQAKFSYNGPTYYLIDTPGHADFSPEMERAIQVMDYAIVILSAVEGVEGHTETVWQLLQKHQVPVFFFINKTDREGADPERVLEEIQANLTGDVCDVTASLTEGDMNEDLIEFLAERDETLLNRYMDTGYDGELWLQTMKRMIRENRLSVSSSGSALKDIGVLDFFEKVDELTETSYDEKGLFAGLVHKIRYDESGSRVTYMKCTNGALSVRDIVTYGAEESRKSEKVNQLRLYNGSEYEQVDRVEAGELFAVVGLSEASIGEGVGEFKESSSYEMVPTLKSKVLFNSSMPVKEVLHSFRQLDAEDPSLQVVWDEVFQTIYIHVMGAIQLEVLEQVVNDRFGFKVEFAEPEILYMETIDTAVNGYGHFEPLKHYAEVHLKLEPGERGSGITFENVCHTNNLSIGHQNLIMHHIFERHHHGLLTGSPLTDVKITLLTGRAHNKHTSGGDFREATYRAIRQGIEKAQNIVLEPFYNFKIKVDLDSMGRVLADVEKAHGTFNPPETVGDKAIITGKAPVATFKNYNMELVSFTHGKGVMSLRFEGYDRCHNEDDVISKIDYDKNADPEYTSTSIFCTKGKGYKVPWDEAEEAMHVEKK
ncbi:GTP-binding protein [Virgibacillus kekensis]|uniref:GTP-binding protein n=1 Tax=Virgibacillus kekensis TaxID=202261 RepID=A0ABV9DMT6_9BACI